MNGSRQVHSTSSLRTTLPACAAQLLLQACCQQNAWTPGPLQLACYVALAHAGRRRAGMQRSSSVRPWLVISL